MVDCPTLDYVAALNSHPAMGRYTVSGGKCCALGQVALCEPSFAEQPICVVHITPQFVIQTAEYQVEVWSVLVGVKVNAVQAWMGCFHQASHIILNKHVNGFPIMFRLAACV